MTKAKIKNSNELRKFIPKETGIKETKNLLLKIQIKKSAIALLYLGIFGFQQTCEGHVCWQKQIKVFPFAWS